MTDDLRLTISENTALSLDMDGGSDTPLAVSVDGLYELTMEEAQDITVDVDDGENLDLDLDTAVITRQYDTPAYTGSYDFTPTQETQTVNISGLRARHDITINPIPSNYGLIIWDGSVLKVT